MFDDLFAGRARRIMVVVVDALGGRDVYDRPGVANDVRWTWRVPRSIRRGGNPRSSSRTWYARCTVGGMDLHGAARDASAKTSSPPFAARQACVAVAEDDDDMREVLVHGLERDGHRVIALSNGVQLLIHLAHQFRPSQVYPRIDLIISDIRMPAMTGIELLRGLRQGQCPIPVILMTAFGDASTRTEAESLGAVMLDKPLSISHLRAEALRLLGEQTP